MSFYTRHVFFAVFIMLAIPQVVFAEYGGEIKLNSGATRTVTLSSYWTEVMNAYGNHYGYIWDIQPGGTSGLVTTVRKKTKTSCEIVIAGGKTGKATLRYWNLYTDKSNTTRTCEITWDIIVDGNSSDSSDNNTIKEVPPFEPYADSWDKSGNYDLSWYTSNKTASEYIISTNKELAGLSIIVNQGYSDFSGKTIKLGADIDLSGKAWVPIGKDTYLFKGIFDGQNHTVSGVDLSVSDFSDWYIGFFHRLDKSSVKNLTLFCDIYLLNALYKFFKTDFVGIGGLVGYADGATIDNCISYTDVIYRINGERCHIIPKIGGLIGYASSCTISKCKHEGDIRYIHEKDTYIAEEIYIGGLIGDAQKSTITFSESTNSSIRVDAACISIGYTTPKTINYGGLNGYGYKNTLLCCRSISDFTGNYVGTPKSTTNNMYFYVYGISNSKYDTITNCYSVIRNIFSSGPSAKTKVYYKGIGEAAKVSFNNSDCTITEPNGTVTGTVDGAYTSEQMKTKTFLDDLNTYSMLEMDEPVWVQGEDGYPINKYFYSPSAGIDDITVDEDAQQTIYSISGVRLKNPQKGLNIINGKKVLVK